MGASRQERDSSTTGSQSEEPSLLMSGLRGSFITKFNSFSPKTKSTHKCSAPGQAVKATFHT